jgi:iron complex outermembrane receptor protein
MSKTTKFPKKPFAAVILFTCLLTAGLSPAFSQDQEKAKQEEEKEKPVKITEEILVIGKAPKELPIATVTSIELKTIELMKPLDLSEAIKYAPAVMVTVGNKNEYSLKLRGFDNKRIALLIDGVPVIDPYYGSFDLKTVSAGGIESLQVTKGPSSVLYGPNTLGGIVNVITRRPRPEPKLSLNFSYGDRSTKSAGLDSSYQWKNLGFVATAYYQDSDGFNYRDANGVKQARANSDYKRTNLNAKLYYNPSRSSEIMVNGGYYHSEYGMPPDLYSKPRYWRFPNWDRYMLNAGGYTALGERSTLRFRAFYVQYKNSLDWFNDKAMTIRQSQSTFNNADFGVFGIGDFYLSSWNSLKVSVYYQGDRVKTQDDLNLPWTKFNQGTFSSGIEEHITVFEKWKVIAGLSFDYLDKFTGKNTSKVNPLVGLKYSPTDDLDLHLSFAKKSKFPSMNSMYSPSSGNPNLLSEHASTWELGATYSKGIYLTGSVFASKLKDMINSFRLPSGLRTFFNIGEARLNGVELQAQKSWKWLNATMNYTYLDHKNISDNRPLDVLSRHNLNFNLDFTPLENLHLGVFGLYASKSYWYDFNAKYLLNIPSYFNLEAILSCSLGHFAPFIKVSNIFNHYFYTEPGYPWRGRYVEVGLKADVF